MKCLYNFMHHTNENNFLGHLHSEFSIAHLSSNNSGIIFVTVATALILSYFCVKSTFPYICM